MPTDRIISTICEHIVSIQALASRGVIIGTDKSPHHRVIVSALEVIEPGFLVVHICPIPQRVDICQGSRCGEDFAIGIIVIAGDYGAAGVHNPHHIALEVGDIVVHCAVVLHGIGQAALIVEEVNGIAAPGHAHQLAAGVIIAVSGATHSLAGPQTAGIIGEAQASGSVRSSCQAPAVGPGHCPASAVVVAGGIARSIIGDAVAVKGRQQILPIGVAVGISVTIGAENVTYGIIDVEIRCIALSLEQLALVVVGIGNDLAIRRRIGCDIAQIVIGIAKAHAAAQVGIAELGNLQGSCRTGNIPVSIAAVKGAAGDGSQAPQAIVAHGQGSAHTGGHGVQAAIGIVISVSFRVSSAAHLPSLLGQLVVRIVGLIGAKNAGISLLLLAVNQAANGIVGVVILLMTFGFIISSNINSSRVF